MSGQNRPFKYGANDRREFIVYNSEVSLRMINDTGGNPVYIGKAKPGTLEADDKWQIAFVEYDAASSAISLTWPLNSEGNASTEYEFVWDSSTTVTISGITQANPGVVTTSVAHGLSDGDKIIIEGVAGMTQVNFADQTDRVYIVANAGASDFELTDLAGGNVDTSAFGLYTGSGTVNALDAINNTFS